MSVQPSTVAPVLDLVVGQPGAIQVLRGSVDRPVHAYVFLGPPGTGRRGAAAVFAAALVCPNGGCGTCATCTAVLAGTHPDLEVIEREGAAISVQQARDVAHRILLSPRLAKRRVVVLVDFDLPGVSAAALLKAIEEPPDTTVVIVVAESVDSGFVTIASRCLTVPFRPLAHSVIAGILIGEGVEPGVAAGAAESSGGRLDRARLLARDERFGERLELWRSVPSRLDGTGAAVAILAGELHDAASEPVAVVRARQEEELERLAEESRQRGERSIPGRTLIEERHRREQRRVRTDELRAGLAALSSTYAPRLAGGDVATSRVRSTIAMIAAIDQAASALSRNVSEPLLLQALLCELDR